MQTETQPIAVVALAPGYYGNKRRNPGESFEIAGPEHFSIRWMTSTDTRVLAGSFSGTTPEQIDQALIRIDVAIVELNTVIERLSYKAVNGDMQARADLNLAKEALRSKEADRADIENARSGADAVIQEHREHQAATFRAARLVEAQAGARRLFEIAAELDGLLSGVADCMRKIGDIETGVRRAAIQADMTFGGRTGQDGLSPLVVAAVSDLIASGPPREAMSLLEYAENAWSGLFEGSTDV